MSHFSFLPRPPHLTLSSINYSSTSTYSIHTMPSINKTSRREHSEREISAILALHAKGYSAQEIDDETDVPKLTIIRII
jgi:hypothetical protein